MSSHHFVREEQEPALLIMDVEAAEKDTIQQLLEWSPTVIVTEDTVQKVVLWGIKIDVVIAPPSHIEYWKESLQEQAPIKILSCASGKETLSTALYFLIASKQKAVNILSSQPLTEFESFGSLDLTVFQSGKRWSFIRSGYYEKWLPAGSMLHIYPKEGASVHHIQQDGRFIIERQESFWISEE